MSRFLGARQPDLVASFGPRTDLHICHGVRSYAVWAHIDRTTSRIQQLAVATTTRSTRQQ
jgi:hypothetical protein